ncbi:protein spotted leaf 11 [Cocos nucifera]|uniref:Protein spotted leaf 11 n=1 Tax=Cocos nucifera TaxID=13894 RepID=A0A8K0IXB2_COCNU|nr:protein spotted leaf 11 [Cocos nucifera]
MKLPETPDPLDNCRRLLASAASAAAAVQSFRGRWSAVTATLGRLRVALDDISDLPSHSHPLAEDLLRSLSQTLSLTLTLALHCRSPEPPAGKLHTQSDIAAASAALDQLAADADLLLRTGALLDPPPTSQKAAAAASGTSRRESVRSEARTLVTRLQIGSPASRIAALDSLNALLREDDKNILIAAAQGVVPALLRLLDSSASSGEARAKAVAVIARIATVDSCRHVLVADGARLLHHLARALESGGAAREKACTALQTLTLAKDNAMAVGSRGGIAALLEVCRAGTPSAQAAAAGVLKNLAGVQELRENFLEENGVPVLVRLLASGTPLAQENAIGCLRNLAAGEEGESFKLAIFKDGGLDCLKNYWESGGSGNDRRLESAIGLLCNLASFRYIAEVATSAGFLPRVIVALDSTTSGTRAEAARAISELAAVGKTRKELGDAIPRLIRMLEAKAAEEKEAAVKALASLLSFPGFQRIFRKAESGVLNVVQLLDPLVWNVEKKYPVSVLLSVSQSRRCRKQMVAMGACGYLQSLAAMEVEGAKKLLESLGRGKLWRVFPRT